MQDSNESRVNYEKKNPRQLNAKNKTTAKVHNCKLTISKNDNIVSNRKHGKHTRKKGQSLLQEIEPELITGELIKDIIISDIIYSSKILMEKVFVVNKR